MTRTATALFADAPLTGIDVEHAFDLEIHFQPTQTVTSPVGATRMNFIIDHGVARGPLLSGEFLAGGGDWVTLGADGVARIDVRATLRLDDGHLALMTNTGRFVADPTAVERFLAGDLIGGADAYARTSPLFETDSESHSWLNRSTFTAVNEVALDRVHYRIYLIR